VNPFISVLLDINDTYSVLRSVI